MDREGWIALFHMGIYLGNFNLQMLLCSDRLQVEITWTGNCCLVVKSRPSFCVPVDHSLSGSSVHGISQARVLEWVTISFSRGSSWPRGWTYVSCIGRQLFTIEPPGKPNMKEGYLIMLPSPCFIIQYEYLPKYFGSRLWETFPTLFS